MDLENEPSSIVEKDKWNNRLDEAYGLISLSISPYLLFLSLWFDHSKTSVEKT